MTLFPVGLAVVVLLDGHPIASYVSAVDAGGHVSGPAVPFLSHVADRGWREGADIVFERGDRRTRVRLGAGNDAAYRTYVELAQPLRALGERVRYDPRLRALVVTSPERNTAPLQTPTPFVPGAQMPARNVFTPEPVATPRPVWTGSPLPRRTPLPYPPGSPKSRTRR